MSLIELKRKHNERKFAQWEELSSGGRRYTCEVSSPSGWKARYVKEVDAKEKTLRFYQEIYNENDELIELHEKYPIDKGHKKVRRRRTGDNSR